MARGDGQQGRRRGVYQREDREPPADPGEWSEDDREHYRQLIADSPLASAIAKSGHARRAQRQADKARAEAEDLDRRMREVRLDMIRVRVERGDVQRLQPGRERHVHGA